VAEDELGYRPECHLANSGAVLNFPDLHLDAVRLGILAYGIRPPDGSRQALPVQVEPCFRLTSEVIDLHVLSPGEGVSYCHSFVADKMTTVATMPYGYADGLPWALRNRAEVLLHGKRYPLVGNVTMDYAMADVGEAQIAIGDEAVFVGRQGDEEITVEDLAERLGTVPYELTCAWGRRVRRVYTEG
jgi:alanine racemase